MSLQALQNDQHHRHDHNSMSQNIGLSFSSSPHSYYKEKQVLRLVLFKEIYNLLNKSFNLIPVPEVDVSLVNSSQNSKVVFTDASSASYIADLNILNVELYLNNASNICIYYSNITNYLKTSINIYNSSDNEIIGNNIYNSNIGILLDQSTKDNKISNNIIHK